MFENKKILAIIPARGGSKGVPKKNIIEIFGKPLIQHSIECALNSKYIDKVIVSTEDIEIAEIAKKCGAYVPFLRIPELATDTSKTIDALVYTIKELEKLGEKFDYLVLLQPTTPLRKSYHIDEALENLMKSPYNDLVSVCEVKEHPILMRTLDKNNVLCNLLNTNSTMRRQDFSKVYIVNGAIYINKLDDSFNSSKSLNDANFSYIMDEKFSVDIDTYLDIKIVEYYLEEERKEFIKLMK